MVWSQFSTKVLQITILHTDDCDMVRVKIQKKVQLQNKIHYYIIKYIHAIMNPKYLKKEK